MYIIIPELSSIYVTWTFCFCPISPGWDPEACRTLPVQQSFANPSSEWFRLVSVGLEPQCRTRCPYFARTQRLSYCSFVQSKLSTQCHSNSNDTKSLTNSYFIHDPSWPEFRRWSPGKNHDVTGRRDLGSRSMKARMTPRLIPCNFLFQKMSPQSQPHKSLGKKSIKNNVQCLKLWNEFQTLGMTNTVVRI